MTSLSFSILDANVARRIGAHDRLVHSLIAVARNSRHFERIGVVHQSIAILANPFHIADPI